MLEKMNNSSAVYTMNQEKCSASGVSTAFTVALSTVSFLAIAGNLLVITTFIKTPNLKASSNYYIVSMAVSDLVCVSLNWPLYATEGMLKAGGSLFSDPTLATLFCKLGIYSRAVSYLVSILSLVLILVDRFIAIVFPLRTLNITARTRKMFLFLSWFLSLLSVVPFFVHAEIIKIEQNTFCRNIMSDLALKTYNFLSFTLFYCAPLILILVLYPVIMKHLRRREKLDKGNRGTIQAARVTQNKNIMKIFGSVTLGFFTCWTPLYVYLFLKMLYPSIFIKDKCAVFVGLFYYIFPLLSTAINPLILISFSSNYRGALKGVFSRLFLKCNTLSESRIERTVELQLGVQSSNMNKISPKY